MLWSWIPHIIAILSASVPPEVKKIELGDVLSNLAIVLREFSTIIFDSLP